MTRRGRPPMTMYQGIQKRMAALAAELLAEKVDQKALYRLMRSKGWTWWAVGTCWVPASHRRGHG